MVTAARHHAIDVVRSWGLDGDDVGLVTNELAANAVLHGQSPFTVTIWREEQRVTVEVADENPALPTAFPTSPLSATSGRGLVIVDRVSAQWGMMPSTGGKV